MTSISSEPFPIPTQPTITTTNPQSTHTYTIPSPSNSPPVSPPHPLQERQQLMRTLQQSHNDRVFRETKTSLVNGHILALPYSDRSSDAIAEAVLNTGIHRTVDDRVKFSMAAYAEPVGCAFVCCIWVYVAALHA